MSKDKKIKILITAFTSFMLFPIVLPAAVSFNNPGAPVIVIPERSSNPVLIAVRNFEPDIVKNNESLITAKKNHYDLSLSFINPSMGDVSGGGDYPAGVPVTLYAAPKEGCRFVKWVESGSTGPVCSLIPSDNTRFTAMFAPIDTPSLTAESSGYDSITLAWTRFDYAAGYEICRSDKLDGEYSLIYTAAAELESFVDKGLKTGRTYYYKIRTICACETAAAYGSFSGPASAAPKVAAPFVFAAVGGYRSVRVSWETATGASGYEICRSAAPDGSYSKVCTLKFSEASGYTDYGLTPDNVYFYKVRAYRKTGKKTYYSDYSDFMSARSFLAAPALIAVSASDTSIRLKWNAPPGVSGCELFRSTSLSGTYQKIYTAASASTAVYTNKGLKTGLRYYYKIRAYGKQGSNKVYGAYSEPVPAVPLTALAERKFTILYQKDPKWRLSANVRKRACLMCAYVITINNMGIEATPKTFYASNRRSTHIRPGNLAKKYGVKPVCAVDLCSPYLKSYSGFATYIKSPSLNGAAAIKEALNKHPEGVICYFKRGGRAHAIVACKYDGNTIYYSDPGRSRKKLLTFNNTWVRCHHRMGYGNLSYIVALDEIND